MKAQAYILKTAAGQWMVEVWRDGEQYQTVAGLDSEMDAYEQAGYLADDYPEGLDLVLGGRRS